MTSSDQGDLSKKLSAWTVTPAPDPDFHRAVWRRIAARQAGDEEPDLQLDQATLGQLPLES